MKQRLIDANKLEPDTCYARSLNKAESLYDYSYSERQINDAPTVDAIPIEWINRYLLDYLYLDNERLPDDEVDDGYYYIETMVSNWRKEKDNE